MEYTIVYSQNITKILEPVNEKIREGWVPQGSPFDAGAYLGQALIRGGRMMGGRSRKNRNRKNRTRKHR